MSFDSNKISMFLVPVESCSTGLKDRKYEKFWKKGLRSMPDHICPHTFLRISAFSLHAGGASTKPSRAQREGRKRGVKTKRHVRQVISCRISEARHARRRISHFEPATARHLINKHSWHVFWFASHAHASLTVLTEIHDNTLIIVSSRTHAIQGFQKSLKEL